jgi:hypothetical protein
VRITLALALGASALGGACQATADTDTADGGSRPPASIESPLPDSTGWGTQVLTFAEDPDGAVWVGTYGEGIYVSRDGSGRSWERLRDDGEDGSISWGFVNAIAFAPGEVWYGTVGNGWGMSTDGGRTWKNWTFSDLGPRWQYVAPGGIATVGDTVYIATADGLRITSDDGESYRDATEATGLPNKYLLGLAVRPREGQAPARRVSKPRRGPKLAVGPRGRRGGSPHHRGGRSRRERFREHRFRPLFRRVRQRVGAGGVCMAERGPNLR